MRQPLSHEGFRIVKAPGVSAGLVTELEIKVSMPAVTHTVSARRLQDWLECSGMTPREQALKHRLRQILDGQGPGP